MSERGLDAEGRRRYRFGIIVLAGLGVVMGATGIVFADARTLLFALSGTGLFGAVLLYLLVPERFVTATLARRTYAPLAEVGPLFVEAVGLPDRQVYVPTGDDEVRLVIPAGDTVSVDIDEVASVGVHADDTFEGIVLPTTGNGLLAEFRDRTDTTLATDAEELVVELLDVLVEEFELVEQASSSVSMETGQATIAVEGSCYGPPTTFDHPVTAFLAAGLANGLKTEVALDPPPRAEDGHYVISCRW
ncbi:hypothetical protein ACUJ40_11015 [Halococcus saccharolyticus]